MSLSGTTTPPHSCFSIEVKTEEKIELRHENTIVLFYGFKAGLNQEKCFQRLQLAFGDESPYRATVIRWFKEFCRDPNSLQVEEHTGRPQPAVIQDVSTIQKMLMDNNRCTYHK
ncbi:histone-lysine N-methyltransferase SETMAR [Trichonephila clavipes]|nr:histone-lysine N-methyltransferase SETMAR [Trichonephila clavipes]